ncbi:MAG: Lrp/AsnC family transcriptional regulator [Candidatus Thiodiazotropha taylori]|nr:Lrp/AsnC family transcriptional regulator [Candidatus Thiodiazotropha taylori]
MAFDRIDRTILNQLQADGRITNAQLAERVNLSPSACLRRVHALEEHGVIERYTALVNQEAAGKPSNVFVEISLNSQSEEALEAFERQAAESPDIQECHLMAGDFDYLIRVAVADAKDYERIHKSQLSRLPHVAHIKTSFALRTICKKTAFEF